MLKKQDTPSKSSAPNLNVAAFFCVACQEITHRIEAETLSVEPQMRNRFWSILEFWERETGTTSGAVTGLVQRALLSAAAEQIGPLRGLRVVVDPDTGDIRAFATLRVVEKVMSKNEDIAVTDARISKPDVKIGGGFESWRTDRGVVCVSL